MKIGKKIFLAVTASLFLLGMGLIATGSAIGGKDAYSYIYENADSYAFVGRWNYSTYSKNRHSHNKADIDVATEEEALTEYHVYNDEYDHELSYDDGYSSGVTTLIDGQELDINANVDYLDINLSFGTVTIEKGDKLTVKSHGDVPLEISWDSGYAYINQNFSGNSIWNGNHKDARYTVTVPDSVSQIYSYCDAGDITISNMNLDMLDIETAAGQTHIENCNSTTISIEIDAGKIEGTGITCESLYLDCNAGKIEMDVDIKNDVTADVSVGSIVLNVPKYENCSWDISTELGHIKFGDNKYSGIDSYSHSNNGEPRFNLNCSIGSIDVNFK